MPYVWSVKMSLVRVLFLIQMMLIKEQLPLWSRERTAMPEQPRSLSRLRQGKRTITYRKVPGWNPRGLLLYTSRIGIKVINTTSGEITSALIPHFVVNNLYKKFPQKGVAFKNRLCYNNFCPLEKGVETEEICGFEKTFKKSLKKLLTKDSTHDILNELRQYGATTKHLDK